MAYNFRFGALLPFAADIVDGIVLTLAFSAATMALGLAIGLPTALATTGGYTGARGGGRRGGRGRRGGHFLGGAARKHAVARSDLHRLLRPSGPGAKVFRQRRS